MAEQQKPEIKETNLDSELSQEEIAKENENLHDDTHKGPEQEVPDEESSGAEADKTIQASEVAESEEANEAADGEEASEVVEESEVEKKSLFKKREKKNKTDEQIADLTDRLKRQMAEFDNFRKRTEKEKAQMYEIGVKSVVEKILPVVDNFERGLAAADNAEDAFVQGMDKIYKQFMTELDNIGIKPIEAVGQEFNPDLHNAVMQVESDVYDSGIVAQELQKGYMYRESVVRHSMVAVVQ
ncbi:nucleotide exchange factor GrpE [Lachnospiraceae bacterium ZAX-1]